MNRSPRTVVLLRLLVSTAFGQDSNKEDRLPPTPEGRQWKLVWHDEFAGSTLDQSKWETPPDGKRRDAWWMREAASLDENGHLVMRTFKEGDRYIELTVLGVGVPSSKNRSTRTSRNSPFRIKASRAETCRDPLYCFLGHVGTKRHFPTGQETVPDNFGALPWAPT